jgi:hypothetical protein
MSALQTLMACNERGVLVSVDDNGDLYVRPKEKLTPELRSALREHKDEIVNGSEARPQQLKILQLLPADGWYALYGINCRRKDDPKPLGLELDLVPLTAWALVEDPNTGDRYQEGMTIYEFEAMACLVTDIYKSSHNRTQFLRYIAPEYVDEQREDLAIHNSELQREIMKRYHKVG